MEYSGTLVIVPSSTRESYFRSIYIHGKANNSTPIGMSSTSLRQHRTPRLCLVSSQHRCLRLPLERHWSDCSFRLCRDDQVHGFRHHYGGHPESRLPTGCRECQPRGAEARKRTLSVL